MKLLIFYLLGLLEVDPDINEIHVVSNCRNNSGEAYETRRMPTKEPYHLTDRI